MEFHLMAQHGIVIAFNDITYLLFLLNLYHHVFQFFHVRGIQRSIYGILGKDTAYRQDKQVQY